MNFQNKKIRLFSIFLAMILLSSIFLTSCATSGGEEYTVEKAKTGRIGCLLGSTTALFLDEEYPDAEILQYNTMADAINALKTSKIDYFAGAERFLNLYAQKLGGLKLLDETFIPANLGFAVQKGNTELAEKINGKLKEYTDNGRLNEIISHWEDCNNYVIEDIPENTEGPTLIVGTTGEMEPHNFISDEKLAGIDVEIIGNILYELGYQVKYELMSFGALLPALSSGKIDIIASDLSITEERKQSVDFTDPYVVQLQTFLVRDTGNNEQAVAKSYTEDDFKKAKIATLLGSYESIYLHDNYKDAEILDYNTIADQIAALQSNKADFLSSSSSYIDLYSKKIPNLKNTNFQLCPGNIGFGMRKDDTELLSKINEKINEYKNNGRLEEICSNWIKTDEYIINDIPKNSDGETIIIGTTGELEPFNFYVNNELVGLDIEIISNILYDLGYKVEYKCMAFGALIPALTSGKIRVIATGMYITEERKQSINFSDIYYTDNSTFAYLEDESSSSGFISKIKSGLYNNIIKENRYKMLIDGLKMTGALALTSGIFGTLLGILLCLMKRSRSRILRAIKNVYSAIIEGTPMVVILMIVCYIILGKVDISGVIVGMIAFGAVFANDVCSALENGLNNVEPGQYEAVSALGYPKGQGFRKIILPQLIGNFLPIYRSSFTSMIKATAIAGYVAIQDLTKAGDIIRSRTFDAFIPLIIVAIIYFIVIWIITLILRYFEKSENRNRKKRKIKL